MATFNYVKKGGGIGTIDAPDSNTALKMLPADANPSSGVMGSLSGTGTPAPGTPAPLPDVKKGNLVSFADSLNEVVNIARKKRNELSVGVAGKYRGTVGASSFGNIVATLNRASNKSTENLLKRTQPDIITSTDEVGNVHGIDKNTGKILWTAPGVGNKQSDGAGSLVKSGALNYTRADYSEDASALEQSRGTDGWVDPTIYKKLYDAWVAGGGKIADFVKTYPPAQYVNPENDWLPTYLRPKSSGVVNPFAQ